MRRYFFLFLFSILFINAHSQVNEDFKYFRIYALGGGNYWEMKWKSWDNFSSSYNLGYGTKLNGTLSAFDPIMGYYGGVGVRLVVFGVEYSIYRAPDQIQTLSFQNGDKMEFQLITKGYNMNFPIVMPVSKRFSIGVDMGLKSLNGELHSRTVYADGTVSYGEDQETNGIFQFNNRWQIFIGPRFEFGKRLRGYLSVTWPMMDSGDVTGLQDLGSDYGLIWSNQLRTVYLPEHWNNRHNDLFYFVGNEPLLREFKGMQVQLGLAFDVFKFNMFD